ncbi:MAG: hypothetical protein AB7P76_03605 [Candidatus Melainabacteria bacterium]
MRRTRDRINALSATGKFHGRKLPKWSMNATDILSLLLDTDEDDRPGLEQLKVSRY